MFWNTFEMKTTKPYYELYLKCDILVFADVFEKIRNSSLKNYELCPSHYLRAPGLSWDAMLSMTNVELELISDGDMYLFFEKGMRGGLSDIFKRYSKANIRYLKSYNPKQKSKHIIYLGRNNFYSYEMSKFFPSKWV